MAFGNKTKWKERHERQIAIKGTSNRGGALAVDGPVVYHVLADGAAPPLDGVGTSAAGRKLIRRVQHGFSAELDDKRTSIEMVSDGSKNLKLLGCGVRVYRSQFALAFRDKQQIEIETLQVEDCFVLCFMNYTRRLAGLLRFNNAEFDGHLLLEFLRAAAVQMGGGDEVRLVVCGGAFKNGEERPATVTRRNKLLIAIEGIVRTDSAIQAGPARLANGDIQVDWAEERGFNFRVQTWDGSVTIAPCSSKQRQTT